MSKATNTWTVQLGFIQVSVSGWRNSEVRPPVGMSCGASFIAVTLSGNRKGIWFTQAVMPVIAIGFMVEQFEDWLIRVHLYNCRWSGCGAGTGSWSCCCCHCRCIVYKKSVVLCLKVHVDGKTGVVIGSVKREVKMEVDDEDELPLVCSLIVSDYLMASRGISCCYVSVCLSVCLSVCVCVSHTRIVLKQLHKSSWFLQVHRFSSTTLCFRKMRISPKIGALFSGTLDKNLAAACWPSVCAV